MQIQLNKIGKQYNREWIFKNLSYTFLSNKMYAITGVNGSGKSTLLQTIAGSMNISEGEIQYLFNNNKITTDNIYQYISIAAPYLDLIDEMSVTEFLQFHSSFKKLILPIKEIIEIIGLQKAVNKQIRYYSSGMKQRVKLAQAIFADTPIILLDEPCTNLDKEGFQLYYNLIEKYCTQKLVIVCSNDENEINFCKERLNIMDWK
ncbi:MAG: ATP-binding cassette domain-containing protein [Chitinophagales bacterium]|nr:ATP-binding cassette domain-containing protein [Chitinophagales bacterium]